MTKVVFRKWRNNGDIIALFPEEPWNPDKGTIASYMHTGQHSDADYHHVLSKTRPAREDEYRPLLAELKRVGYNRLSIVKRYRQKSPDTPSAEETIVTNISEGISYYRELASWVRSCGMNPGSKMFDALSLMEGDIDKIRWAGYEMHFIEVVRGKKKFILTGEEVDAESRTMLERFHRPDFERWYESLPGDWDVFNETEYAIACRRGCNYYYTLWKYLGDKEPS